MKLELFKTSALLVAVLLHFQMLAQEKLTPKEKVEETIRKYQRSMILGKGTSDEMSNEVINEFKSIFEPNAFLPWDLYRTNTDSLYRTRADSLNGIKAYLRPMEKLSVIEYVRFAQILYNNRLLETGLVPSKKPKIKIKDGQFATVYLDKFNKVRSASEKLKITHEEKLELKLNIYEDKALIQNIVKDTRYATVRTISAIGGYVFWNNAVTSIVKSPESNIDPELVQSFEISASPQFMAGLNMEFRLNRYKNNGIIIETGFILSQVNFDISITNYENTYRMVFDQGSQNPFECSVFDRSDLITENIDNKSFTLPLAVKAYLNKPSWIYFKAGPMVTYNIWTTKVKYDYSHTGGGKVVNIFDENQYYIIHDKGDEFNEMNSPPRFGFLSRKSENFSTDPGFKEITFSVMFGAGMEKRFSKVSIGLEPALIVGQNTVTTASPVSEYLIYPESAYQSFVKTLESPGLSFSGIIMLRFSYFF